MNKDSIKGMIDVSLFSKLDYEVLKNKLEYTFNPYIKIGTNKIVFEVNGNFEDLQKFNAKWNELEKIENSKPTQKEYTIFETIIFSIGAFLKLSYLPIAKITNKGNTEFYTLYNNGSVICQGKDSKVKDKIYINMCNEESFLEFEKAVYKIKKDK